ncbi:MAG: SDR family oxidoreductase [Methylobacteriaceae bacterium]|nr:SDR family oxidoreductase [Methylobacteriaceae bacterium]
MIIDFSGKTAIVTGSTEGIGYAIAAGLAESGARVVVNGRTQAKVDEALAKLKSKTPGTELRGFAGDLATGEGCDALLRAFPDTDILVNNVGIYEAKPFFDIPDEDWERFFQTNVMSGVRLSRGYMRGMLERNWGRVIFLSSESGVNIPDDMLHYGFTKTAVLALSRGLAKLARGTGVTVNAVLPGPTMSAGVERMLQGAAEKSGKTIEQAGIEFVKTKRATSIIQRVASPEEVANMVVYACSPQASATTGAALRVEGGIVETIA